MTLPLLSFGSNAPPPRNQLSNFHEAPIRVRRHDILPFFMGMTAPAYASWIPEYGPGVVFPSSEHFWQSLKACDAHTFHAFTADVALGKLTPDAFAIFFPARKNADKALAKCAYWSKKRNVGILAKLAVSKARQRALGKARGWQFLYPDTNDAPMTPKLAELEACIWTHILTLKFEQNPGPRLALMYTGNAHLYEQARMNPGHWAGMVTKEGTFEGENAMGRYMMAVRSVFGLYIHPNNDDEVEEEEGRGYV